MGKLGFSQTDLFGKFARAHLRPLYRKFFARHYQENLFEADGAILTWWIAVLTSSTPRIRRSLVRCPDTDADLLSVRFASAAISSLDMGPRAPLLVAALKPSCWPDRFSEKNHTIWMEMLAPLAFPRADAHLVRWGDKSLYRQRRISQYPHPTGM